MTKQQDKDQRSAWLKTDRLYLSNWSFADAEAAFAIYGDPIAMRFMHPNYPVVDVAAMRTRLGEIIERNKSFADGFGSWPIFRRDNDMLIGAVLLKPLPDSTQIEVGWHLARSEWGNGYATEAGRAALQHGFHALALKTIFAVVDPENTASMAVCRRLGMTHLGQTDQFYDRSLEYFSIGQAMVATG